MNLWKSKKPRLVVLGSKDASDDDDDFDWDELFSEDEREADDDILNIVLKNLHDKMVFGDMLVGDESILDEDDYEDRVDDSTLFNSH